MRAGSHNLSTMQDNAITKRLEVGFSSHQLEVAIWQNLYQDRLVFFDFLFNSP